MYGIEILFNVFAVTLNSLCDVEAWNPCQDERKLKCLLSFLWPSLHPTLSQLCIDETEMMTGSHNLHIRNWGSQSIQNVIILNLCFYIFSAVIASKEDCD